MTWLLPAFGVSVGIFCLVGGVANWEWFMTAYNARKLVGLVGRGTARVIYIVFGLILIAGAVQMLWRGDLGAERDEVEEPPDEGTTTG